jgi:hypothetical protein
MKPKTYQKQLKFGHVKERAEEQFSSSSSSSSSNLSITPKKSKCLEDKKLACVKAAY